MIFYAFFRFIETGKNEKFVWGKRHKEKRSSFLSVFAVGVVKKDASMDGRKICKFSVSLEKGI